MNVIKQATAWFLTAGAALTLGLLSFAGVMSLTPLVPLGITAFFVAALYEAEVYRSNIVKGAFVKLFEPRYVKRLLARELLLDLIEDETMRGSHPFYKEYYTQLQTNYLHANGNEQKSRANYEYQLAQMETFFLNVLFANVEKRDLSDYEQLLYKTIDKKHTNTFVNRCKKRLWINRSALMFSTIAGILGGVGTILLLFQILPLLPFFAGMALSMSIPLMTIVGTIAGIAYLFITYNALTDIIEKGTFRQLCSNIIKSTIVIAVVLILSYLTAGTWWGIAAHIGAATTHFAPAISWLKHHVPFIQSIFALLSPIAFRTVKIAIRYAVAISAAISDAIFTLPNIMQTFKSLFSVNTLKKVSQHITSLFHRPTDGKKVNNDNLLQKLNIFLLIFNLLKPAGLIGHVFSETVSSTKGSHISSLITAVFKTIGIFFTELHYFISGKGPRSKEDALQAQKDDPLLPIKYRQQAEHGHNHGKNLLTPFINIFGYLAVGYDYLCSQANRLPWTTKKVLTWREACNKIFPVETVSPKESISCDNKAVLEWNKQLLIQTIQRKLASFSTTDEKDTIRQKKRVAWLKIIEVLTNCNKPIIDALNEAKHKTIDGETISIILAKHRSRLAIGTTKSIDLFNQLTVEAATNRTELLI